MRKNECLCTNPCGPYNTNFENNQGFHGCICANEKWQCCWEVHRLEPYKMNYGYYIIPEQRTGKR